MSIQLLITSGAIVFDNTVIQDPIALALIKDSLERLYRGPEAKSILDTLTPSAPLQIVLSTLNQAGLLQNKIYVNPFSEIYQIDQTGSVINGAFDSILMHEILHALIGLRDTDYQALDGSVVNPDYAGETVLYTNIIMNQLGFGDRISYSAADVQNTGSDFLQLGTNYTFGAAIDVAIFSHTTSVVDGTYTPGPNPNTSRNTAKVNDLILDAIDLTGATNNGYFRSGLGNDFVYGYGGNDTVNGGAGDDYLSGGVGNDTVDYAAVSGDASGQLVSGIKVNWSGTTATVTDGWIGSDTLVDFERLSATNLDDLFILSGDFTDTI